jgi:EpsI family protein
VSDPDRGLVTGRADSTRSASWFGAIGNDARIPLIYALLAASLVATWPSVGSLIAHWWNVYDYHYGFLVGALSLIWLVGERKSAAFRDPQSGRLAPWALPIVLVAWLVAVKGNSVLAHQLLLPAVLGAVVFAVGGAGALQRAATPLVYLYFAIPVWDYLVPVLQQATIAAMEVALGVLKIPAVVDNFTVTLPSGKFQIIEGCSGRRYFVVALAIAYAAGVVQHVTWPRRILLLGLAAVLAIVANWVRVLIVIIAGHLTDMRHYLVAVEHQSLGLALFVVLLVAIIVVSVRLQGAGAVTKASDRGTASGAARKRGPWVIAALSLVAAGVWVSVSPSTSRQTARLAAVPVLLERWQGPFVPDETWHPHFVGASDSVRVAYSSQSGRVEVYLNTYGVQRPGAKLIYFENTLWAPRDWSPVADRSSLGSLPWFGSPAPVVMDARSPSGELWSVSYLYRVGGRSMSHALLAQLSYGVGSLTHAPAAGVVAFATRCANSCEVAHRLLADFWAGPANSLTMLLPEVTSADENPTLIARRRES